MATILFSSGTSGNKPKAVMITNQDLKIMRKAMAHFWELCPCDGPVLQTLPAYPHLGYHFAKIYEEFCPYPVIHTGGYKLLPLKQHLGLIEQIKPKAIIGVEETVMELVNLSGQESIKIAVIANGVSREAIKSLEAKGINVRATYGLTEAKMAWFTGPDWQEGYYVFKDCGVTFKVKNGELIMYSKDFPNGYQTGDMGSVEDFEDYQQIGFFIKRKDKKQKNMGCTR